MKFLKGKIIFIVILVVIGAFIICHSTPSLATRTHIFMEGYPLDAFGKAVPDYVITKNGFLYFAHDYESSNTP